MSCNATKQRKKPEDLPESVRIKIISSANLFEEKWTNHLSGK